MWGLYQLWDQPPVLSSVGLNFFLIEYGWVLQIVFLVKGPLYLVSISATDEPAQALRKQLELLHGQVGPWFPLGLTSTLLLLLGSKTRRHLSYQTMCSVLLLLLFKKIISQLVCLKIYPKMHIFMTVAVVQNAVPISLCIQLLGFWCPTSIVSG